MTMTIDIHNNTVDMYYGTANHTVKLVWYWYRSGDLWWSLCFNRELYQNSSTYEFGNKCASYVSHYFTSPQ